MLSSGNLKLLCILVSIIVQAMLPRIGSADPSVGVFDADATVGAMTYTWGGGDSSTELDFLTKQGGQIF